MLAIIPTAAGRDVEASKFHLDRAVELAPDYLMNHVVRAEILGFSHTLVGRINEVEDEEVVRMAEALVSQADIAPWPFWNRIAKRDMQQLVNQL